MTYLMTVAIILLGLLGYIFSLFINWDKLKGRPWLVALIILMAAALVIVQIGQKSAQDSREAQYQSRYDSLHILNQYVITQNDTLRSEVERLSAQLEPVIKLANENFPGLSENLAIKQLILKISKMESKIKFLKAEKSVNSKDGTYITKFYFGSEYPVAVRDINIKLEFDKSLLSAKHYFDGAFVVEQGSNLILTANNKIEFTTGLLAVGNDIVIQTKSPDSLSIIDMSFQSR